MLKLMIVEDEEIIREGLRECLDWKYLGCEIVAEAEDGAEALEKARRWKPDIILTDVVMSGMNGIDFVTKLREEESEEMAKVVMISAHENVGYMKAAFKLEAIDYLLKPFDIMELEQVIRKVVARCEEERAYYNMADKKNEQDEKAEGQVDITSMRKIIRMVLDVIQRRFTEDLTLQQIADEVYLSPNYLAVLFKRETGDTVNEYVTRLRIEKAKELLHEPHRLVADISEAVGYKDSTYFAKLFKKATGSSPKEFREYAR